MATIVIDFDAVMRFGDLHRDIATSLDAHRGVLRIDAGRLDAIIDSYGLSRTTGSAHFQGLSVGAAMSDADARAGRVRNSLQTTSTRIFRYAGQSQTVDDRFNWAGAALTSVGAVLFGPPGAELWGFVVGKIADTAATGAVLGQTVSPGFVHAVPVVSIFLGVLSIADGVVGLLDPYRDTWSTVSSGLRLASGVIGVGIGIAVIAGVAVVSSPVILALGAVASILGVAAFAIESRHEIGQMIISIARTGTRAVQAIGRTAVETGRDLLSGVGDLWDGAVGLVSRVSRGVTDAVFSAVEAVHDSLTSVVDLLFGPLGLLLTQSETPKGWTPPDPPATPTPPVTTPAENTPAPARAPQPGDPSGALPPSGGRVSYEAAAGIHFRQAKWTEGQPANGRADRWDKAAYNCTSWVAFRRDHFGLSIPDGNGGAMGRESGLPPTLGAVVSYGAGTEADFGHVMFVEEVFGPDEFRVSEMNYDNRGGFSEERIWRRQPDGTWSCGLPSPKTSVTLKFPP